MDIYVFIQMIMVEEKGWFRNDSGSYVGWVAAWLHAHEIYLKKAISR